MEKSRTRYTLFKVLRNLFYNTKWSKKNIICTDTSLGWLVDEFSSKLKENNFPENLEKVWLDFLADDHPNLHQDDDRDTLLDYFLIKVEMWIINKFRNEVKDVNFH